MDPEPTVFLVDDDRAARESAKWLLESAGYTVRVYASAADYLNHSDLNLPGCLLLDVRMPEMDGLELQTVLVDQEQRRPIIFLTAYGDVPACARAMKAGATDFLEKPVDGEVLFKRVEKAIELDRQRRQQLAGAGEIHRRLETLSDREAEIMELLYSGKTMKWIARSLQIAPQTVARHRTQVLMKMQVENDAQLVRLLDVVRLPHD